LVVEDYCRNFILIAGDTMMRAFPLKFLKLLPSFIQRLTLHLREGGDLVSKLGNFPKLEIFAQKCLRKTIPCDE